MNKIATVVKFVAEEKMVQEAIAAYRAARKGKCGELYALDLLNRVGTTVPGGDCLMSLVEWHNILGWLPDEMINVELLLRQKRLLLEAELRVTELRIELKKLEIQQLQLELQ